MPKYALTLFTSLALLSAATVAGPLIDAEKLLQHCQLDTQTDFCQGYIAGVVDADSLCVPDDVALSTLADLALSSIKKADTSADTPAAQLVNARLAEVFPCEPETDKKLSSSKHKKNWSNKERIGK